MKYIKFLGASLWVVGLVGLCWIIGVYDKDWTSVEYID